MSNLFTARKPGLSVSKPIAKPNALVGEQGKRYGLVSVPVAAPRSAPPPAVATTASAFSLDDDDGGDSAAPGSAAALAASEKRRVNEQLAREAVAQRQRREALEAHEAAVAQDPSVFDYDEVHDAIEMRKQDSQMRKEIDAQERKPKYMEALLKRAEEVC